MPNVSNIVAGLCGIEVLLVVCYVLYFLWTIGKEIIRIIRAPKERRLEMFKKSKCFIIAICVATIIGSIYTGMWILAGLGVIIEHFLIGK